MAALGSSDSFSPFFCSSALRSAHSYVNLSSCCSKKGCYMMQLAICMEQNYGYNNNNSILCLQRLGFCWPRIKLPADYCLLGQLCTVMLASKRAGQLKPWQVLCVALTRLNEPTLPWRKDVSPPRPRNSGAAISVAPNRSWKKSLYSLYFLFAMKRCSLLLCLYWRHLCLSKKEPRREQQSGDRLTTVNLKDTFSNLMFQWLPDERDNRLLAWLSESLRNRDTSGLRCLSACSFVWGQSSLTGRCLMQLQLNAAIEPESELVLEVMVIHMVNRGALTCPYSLCSFVALFYIVVCCKTLCNCQKSAEWKMNKVYYRVFMYKYRYLTHDLLEIFNSQHLLILF